MRFSFVTRLMLWFGGISVVVTLVAMGIAHQVTRSQTMLEIQENGHTLARYVAARYAARFHLVEAVPRMMAIEMERRHPREAAEIREYLEAVLSSHPNVFGACVAYAPHRFDPAVEWFAPYAWQSDGKMTFLDLGKGSYDYAHKDWYRVPTQTRRPGWSAPYLDEGGGEAVVMTYSVPFEGGVATADISLWTLRNEPTRLHLEHGAYLFILDEQGRYVAHPDWSQILKKAPDDLYQQLFHSGSGRIVTRDPRTGEPAWIYHRHVVRPSLAVAIVYPEQQTLREVHRIQRILLLTGLAYTLLLMVMALVISRLVTRPLKLLTRMAQSVSEGQVNVTMPADLRADEMPELRHAFQKMMMDVQRAIKNLQEANRERDRIENELHIAAQIHRAFLVERFPPWPDRTDFDLYARCREAEQVGGDFYDFFLLGPHHLGFCLGDASGKGIPAAIFMAVCRTLLRAHAHYDPDPALCLREVNEYLCAEGDPSMFVTLVYGVLDTRDGHLRFCNAGHMPPFLLKPDGAVQGLPAQGNPPVGVLAGMDFEEGTWDLGPGEGLFLYTDGITEAASPAGEFYGDERLATWLAAHAGLPTRDLVERACLEAERFAAGCRPGDDVTALVLRWPGCPAPSGEAGVEGLTCPPPVSVEGPAPP